MGMKYKAKHKQAVYYDTQEVCQPPGVGEGEMGLVGSYKILCGSTAARRKNISVRKG